MQDVFCSTILLKNKTSWPRTLNWFHKPLTCGSWPVVWKKPDRVLSFSPNVVSFFLFSLLYHLCSMSTHVLTTSWGSTFHLNRTTVSLCPSGQLATGVHLGQRESLWAGEASLPTWASVPQQEPPLPSGTARLVHSTSRRMSSPGLLWKPFLRRLKNSLRKPLLSSVLAVSLSVVHLFRCLPYIQTRTAGLELTSFCVGISIAHTSCLIHGTCSDF